MNESGRSVLMRSRADPEHSRPRARYPVIPFSPVVISSFSASCTDSTTILIEYHAAHLEAS